MFCPECNSECGTVNTYKCDCGHYKSKHIEKSVLPSALPSPSAATPPTTPRPLGASASFAAPRPSTIARPPRVVGTAAAQATTTASAGNGLPNSISELSLAKAAGATNTSSATGASVLSPSSSSTSMSIPRPRMVSPRPSMPSQPLSPAAQQTSSSSTATTATTTTTTTAAPSATQGAASTNAAPTATTAAAPVAQSDTSAQPLTPSMAVTDENAAMSSPRVPPKRIVNPGSLAHSPSGASMSFTLPPRPDGPTPPPRMPPRESNASFRPSLPPRERDEATIKRHKELVNELILTEQGIVQSLNVLQTHYLPALEQIRQNESNFNVQANDVNSLELNVSVLLTSHTMLLKTLKEIETDECLLFVCKQAAIFIQHLEYLDKYESAIVVLERLKQNKKFKKFLEELDPHFRPQGGIIIIEEGESGSTALLEYLLLPMQKLFAFAALLTEINKKQTHRPPPSDLHTRLLGTFSMLRERMAQCEMTKKVLGIQNVLKDLPPGFSWPLTRTLVRAGKLISVMETTSKKSATMRAQDRVVYLFSDKLLVARREHYLYDLSIASVSIENATGTETDFIVSNSSASVCFRCEDGEERASWMKDLEQAKDAAKMNRKQKQATLRPSSATVGERGGTINVSQHIADELEKLSQDINSNNPEMNKTQRVKICVRIPAHLFENKKSETLSLLIMAENSVETVTDMAIKWARRLPNIVSDTLLPSKFSLFKLEGKELLDDSLPVYAQTANGTIELTLNAFESSSNGEEVKAVSENSNNNNSNSSSSSSNAKDLIGLEQNVIQSLASLRTTYLSALGLIQKEESAFSALPTDVTVLELNLTNLHELHLELFSSLQACNSNEETRTCMDKCSSTFSSHFDYLDKYEASMVVIERLKQKSKFRKWLENVEKQLETKSLTDSLLLPIQKVVVFVEKLQQIFSPLSSNASAAAAASSSPTSASSASSAVSITDGGVAKIIEIGILLNERMKKIEDYKKVKEVQFLLKDLPKDFLWPPSRVLIKQGKMKTTMETFSQKKTQSLKVIDRVIYLFSDKILVTKKDPIFLYEANIASISVEVIAETETDFTLTNSSLSACFRCDSLDERAEWVKEICLAKENAKDIRRSQRTLTQRNGPLSISSFARVSEDVKSAIDSNPDLENSEDTNMRTLFSLESQCIKSLSTLTDIFLPALENLRKKDSEYIADANVFESLNFIALSTLHERLRKDMQEIGNVQEVSVIFVNNKELFACYLEYLDKYESAMSVLEKLKQKSKTKKWIEETEKQLGDSIGEELFRHVVKFVAMIELLIPFDFSLKELTTNLIEKKIKVEEAKKINEAQSLLKDLPKDFNWPAGRILVRSGGIKSTMENYSKRKQSLRVTERVLYLFNDKLVLTKKDHSFLFEANVSSLTVESIPELLTDFAITNSSVSVGFRCESAEEGSAWVRDLQRVSQLAKESRRLQTRGVNPQLIDLVNKLENKDSELGSDILDLEDLEVVQALKQDSVKVQSIQSKLAALDRFQTTWRKRVDAHISALKAFAESSRALTESFKDVCIAVIPDQSVTRVAEQYNDISFQDLAQDVGREYAPFLTFTQSDSVTAQLREKLGLYDVARTSYIRAVREKHKSDEAKKQYERCLGDLGSVSRTFSEAQATFLTPMMHGMLKVGGLEAGAFASVQSVLNKPEFSLR